MLETSVRLLRLLTLLQARRDWSGAELAARLDVTTRTVRNDIERLRHLGYQVHSTTGTGRRLPARRRHRAAAAAARRRRGDRRRGRPARCRRRHRHRHRGHLAARADQARTDPAVPAAAPDRRATLGHGVGGRWRTDRRRRHPDHDRRGGTQPRAAALRLPRSRRPDDRPPRRTAPPRLHRTALVPAGLGHRPPRLADVPRRPDPPRRPDRPALHPARTTRRRRRRPRHARPAGHWPGNTRPGYACTPPPRSSPTGSPRKAGLLTAIDEQHLPAGDRSRLLIKDLAGFLGQPRCRLHRARPARVARPPAHARRPLPRRRQPPPVDPPSPIHVDHGVCSFRAPNLQFSMINDHRTFRSASLQFSMINGVGGRSAAEGELGDAAVADEVT